MRKPSIFAELLKAITLEQMFAGFVSKGGSPSLAGRKEMWNRLCRHTGAPEKQVTSIKAEG
jgi:hypothetical protein